MAQRRLSPIRWGAAVANIYVTERELAEIIQQGHETPSVEFKGPGPRTDRQLFARIARAALAMANRRGGGLIIIGVRDERQQVSPDGLSAGDLATWSYDDVAGMLSAYADPYVGIAIESVSYQGKDFVVISVEEFEETPVLCKKDYQGVLRGGACYVRRKGRTESSEIPNHGEMRDLLELATEKGVRRFLRTANRAGLPLGNLSSHSDTSHYETELESFE